MRRGFWAAGASGKNDVRFALKRLAEAEISLLNAPIDGHRLTPNGPRTTKDGWHISPLREYWKRLRCVALEKFVFTVACSVWWL